MHLPLFKDLSKIPIAQETLKWTNHPEDEVQFLSVQKCIDLYDDFGRSVYSALL